MRNIVRLERREKSGWTVGMVLIPLDGDGLLVYSPTWLGPKTAETVRGFGEPRVIVAPNSFHHVSLGRYREAFPEAMVVASDRARPRLERKGHQALSSLPHGAAACGDVLLVAVPHTKSGELWVVAGGSWVVGDAFFNVPGPLRGAVGALLRATLTGPDLALGQTFRWLALDDERAYRRWLFDELEASPPTAMHFCHGEPIEAADLPDRLRGLAAARLRA
jgi:hypothetical protein